MDLREKDIQLLCEKIKENPCEFIDDDYGPYRYQCRYCYEEISDDKYRKLDPKRNKNPAEFIKHDLNCAYLIAKDLSTRSLQNEE